MNWYKVFDSENEANQNVPERSIILLKIKGRSISFAHTQHGFYAVDDECPHLGESLSKGTVNYLNEIICPWHSHRFHMQNGLECKGRSGELQTYKVEVRADGVFIGMED
ncbi:MAG: Rieske 2Fe-2S domain-containing protein [Flammeovirgaceae bacterium]|nr:Rieske 2Fe-2S domain-containing protein [Flammeovirgaceae bacterium]